MKPGNAGGGKAPWFKMDAGSDEGPEIGKPKHSTESQELQKASHAQAKAGTRMRAKGKTQPMASTSTAVELAEVLRRTYDLLWAKA